MHQFTESSLAKCLQQLAQKSVDILQWRELEFPERCRMFSDRFVGGSCMEVHRCQEKKNRWKNNNNVSLLIVAQNLDLLYHVL